MRKCIIVVVLLLVALSGCVNPPPPASNALYFFPPHSYNHVDEELTINVMLDTVQPVRAWEASIVFNATMIKVIKIEQGDLFSGSDIFQSPNILIDNANGSITRLYALAINHDVSGSGTLLRITFVTDAAGDTNLSFIQPAVYNTTESIPFEVRNATVHIEP